MDKRTEISITIDTEFSIGGALSNPENISQLQNLPYYAVRMERNMD